MFFVQSGNVLDVEVEGHPSFLHVRKVVELKDLVVVVGVFLEIKVHSMIFPWLINQPPPRHVPPTEIIRV